VIDWGLEVERDINSEKKSKNMKTVMRVSKAALLTVALILQILILIRMLLIDVLVGILSILSVIEYLIDDIKLCRDELKRDISKVRKMKYVGSLTISIALQIIAPIFGVTLFWVREQ